MSLNTAPDAPLPKALDRRVYIETFGCQMNILDSELVHDQLAALGYQFVTQPDDASVVLYNTCSVRELSEHKVLSRLGIMRQKKLEDPNIVVGVLGCMAERAGADLAKKYPHIDLMCGPSELDQVPSLIENILAQKAESRHSQIALSGHNARRKKTFDAAQDRLEAFDQTRLVDPDHTTSQSYVRITRGCNKFCSFCIVPMTRGPEVHRSPDAIVDEVKNLVAAGSREATLLGQTINHYQSGDTNFANLLKRVHDENPELKRLRFLTSYPRDFTDEMLDVMAESERMCHFFHIPAQSGSNRMLKLMNRGYTREMYVDLIRRARERMPDVSVLGDMIVGFPGETEEDFEMSLSLLREVRYKSVFVFKYSTRPGTVASKKYEDTIPNDVKKDRNRRMLALQQEISLEHHRKLVGTRVKVLVEGSAKIDPTQKDRAALAQGLVQLGRPAPASSRLSARTRGDHIVAFDGPPALIGKLVEVEITDARELSLSGRLV